MLIHVEVFSPPGRNWFRNTGFTAFGWRLLVWVRAREWRTAVLPPVRSSQLEETG